MYFLLLRLCLLRAMLVQMSNTTLQVKGILRQNIFLSNLLPTHVSFLFIHSVWYFLYCCIIYIVLSLNTILGLTSQSTRLRVSP